MQIERQFKGKSLDQVRADAKAYIEEKIANGFGLSRVNMLRDGDERICCVYMETDPVN